MARYILAPFAQQDLAHIRDYYLQEAGYRTARRMMTEFVEAFQSLAKNPGIGHKREDLVQARPVLFWRVRDFLVVYRAMPGRVEIVTLVHGNRDVASLLARR